MVASPSFVALALLAALVGPATEPSQPSDAPGATFERLEGFSTVVVNHVGRALGSEHLPAGQGVPIEPGMFVTMPLDKLQIFDRDAVSMSGGRVADTTPAGECASGCPAVFYDAFQEAWLELAVEGSIHGVDIPARVLLAAHEQLPMRTLLSVAYAAAETRPVQPPSLHLLVASDRGGVRAQPFFLIPPRGLELRQGSAALGLTVTVGRGGRFAVRSGDPRVAREQVATSVSQLRDTLYAIKKVYPGKETVILVPDDQVTVGETMRAYATVQTWFPRLVLSLGQEVRTP